MATTLVAMFENLTGSGTDNPQDIYTSTDNGVTWVAGTPLVVGDGIYGFVDLGTKMFSDAAGYIYYPDGGPEAFTGLPYDYMVLARSNDAVTWAPNLAPADFDPTGFFDVWITHGFAQISDLHLIAVGFYVVDSLGGTDRHILESTDGGASWTVGQELTISFTSEQIRAWSACVTSEGTVLIGVRCQLTGTNNPVIFRSVDSGASYTEITLPTADKLTNAEWIVYTICDLGDGVILCGGKFPQTGFVAPERYQPRLWRSTDDGASWTEVTSGVGSVTYNAGDTFHAVVDLVKVPDTDVVVLAMQAHPSAVGGGITAWRVSTDNGLTFPIVGTFVDTPTSTIDSQPGQLIVADDNSIIASYSASVVDYELWRGVMDDPPTTIEWTRVAEVPSLPGTDCGLVGLARLGEPEPPGPEPAPPGTPCPDEGGNFFPTADAALIEFGEVEIGDTSEADLIVTNHTLEVLLGTITIAAPFASDPTTLGVSGAATQTLSITFTPTEPGDFMTVMVIQTGVGNVRVVLTGTGVEP